MSRTRSSDYGQSSRLLVCVDTSLLSAEVAGDVLRGRGDARLDRLDSASDPLHLGLEGLSTGINLGANSLEKLESAAAGAATCVFDAQQRSACFAFVAVDSQLPIRRLASLSESTIVGGSSCL